ncbi:MAG TPA: heme exporter protein CcmD [Povalibacter sp.]|nr:heme exporter protein CcmD [Povalibacter sp.]
MSLSEFIHMGGYAPYIWSCYSLTAVVLLGMEWASRRDLRSAQTQARRRAQMAGDQQ